MTQTERVLAALKAHPRGITQVDFLLPVVIDGGRPITRVGARILELRNEGHRIDSAGRRDKCTVYKLAAVSDGSGRGQQVVLGGPSACHAVDVGGHPAPGPSETPALFDPAKLERPLGAYDDVDEAA